MAADQLRQQLLNQALALLARREYSRAELTQKLGQKCDDLRQVEALLDSLAEQGLQSDERFSEAFVRYRVEQGKGPLRIRQDLRQKGIAETRISELIEHYADQWFEQAFEVYVRKFKLDAPTEAKDKAKRLRFLHARGFSPDIAYRVLDRVCGR
ncbi:regulatory protein RecX [Agaribacterium haliotis]|uniref:regulatory protein RecX n=1 Tax=Agaribacterium haliotis TaxID=2013869 RepID=UPI0013044BFA|nr:regulatory protein RecX [Agaribacterium haliotis]